MSKAHDLPWMEVVFETNPEHIAPGFAELVEEWASAWDEQEKTENPKSFTSDIYKTIQRSALRVLNEHYPDIKYPKSYVDDLVFGAMIVARDIRHQAVIAKPGDVNV